MSDFASCGVTCLFVAFLRGIETISTNEGTERRRGRVRFVAFLRGIETLPLTAGGMASVLVVCSVP